MLCTRPDIAFSISTLAQFSTNPGPAHQTALKRLLRYLQRTASQTITYSRLSDSDTQPKLVGFSDADWGQSPDDRRSVTGYAFLLAGGAISWQSKKQRTVALSTVEAEYMALTQASKEAIWWRSTMKGLGYDTALPTVLHCDSQGAIALAKNPAHHSRTKHIAIQYHFTRECIADRSITLSFIGTKEMAADVLTKTLDSRTHSTAIQLLGMNGI
jgi:hypothetical protein